MTLYLKRNGYCFRKLISRLKTYLLGLNNQPLYIVTNVYYKTVILVILVGFKIKTDKTVNL